MIQSLFLWLWREEVRRWSEPLQALLIHLRNDPGKHCYHIHKHDHALTFVNIKYEHLLTMSGSRLSPSETEITIAGMLIVVLCIGETSP